MYRSMMIALLAGVMLVGFATPLPILPNSMTMSGSALAQKLPTSDAINLNSSRSNAYRERAQGGTTGTPKQGKRNPPAPKGDPAAATTVKSSKSNSSD